MLFVFGDARSWMPRLSLSEIQRRGLRGLSGSKRDSAYEPGRRSGTWIKLKCVTEQEFVIGGFTPLAGARKHFGALLVGYYDKGRLRFAGKVGTGFDAKLPSSCTKRMRAEESTTCPFTDLPSKQNGEWVQGITPGRNAEIYLGESKTLSVRSNCRMDPRLETAPARVCGTTLWTRIRVKWRGRRRGIGFQPLREPGRLARDYKALVVTISLSFWHRRHPDMSPKDHSRHHAWRIHDESRR